MKLAKIRIENFRHLGGGGRPFELDFTDPLGRVRDFTLLVGPNTSGKTTILDAIAAALGPTLELPTLRPDFQLSPHTLVTQGALRARITCVVRFDPEEIEAARELHRLYESPVQVPDANEVALTWTYPDPKQRSRWGFTSCHPQLGWTLFKSRVLIARLLSSGRVTWDWFRRAGHVFTFDQDRTGFGKTVSREVWNIIHGRESGTESEPEDRPRTADPRAADRRTSDPKTILIDLAIRSGVPSVSGDPGGDAFKRIQTLFNDLCAPNQLIGARRDALDDYDINFRNGPNDYGYQGLSSGQRIALLLMIRFASEHIHNSIVLVDELELNQHPIWQRRLLHLLPQMGERNQIIATTHSPYLRDAVPPHAVVELGRIGGTEDV